MNITDIITKTLLNLLSEQEGEIQIGRNELANAIGCVPSQINYVITSRFTKEQGYIVESRRGGGGYIKIVKVDNTKSQLILHIINSMGDEIDENTARIIIESLCLDSRIEKNIARIMLSVISDDNFKGLNPSEKRMLRANLFKSMLINL